MKETIKKIPGFLLECIKAIATGQFIFRLKITRFVGQILYTFLLFGLIIWVSLSVERTMQKVEKNKYAIESLEIEHAQKTFELATITKRSNVIKRLAEMGSEVTENTKNSTLIK